MVRRVLGVTDRRFQSAGSCNGWQQRRSLAVRVDVAFGWIPFNFQQIEGRDCGASHGTAPHMFMLLLLLPLLLLISCSLWSTITLVCI